MTMPEAILSDVELLAPVHPGEILREEFLKPLGLSQYRLARELGVQQTLISQIVNGTRGISPETALRLGRYFNTSAELWLNLQRSYDLRLARGRIAGELERIRPREPAAA
jgi:antitoxin HigA-1